MAINVNDDNRKGAERAIAIYGLPIFRQIIAERDAAFHGERIEARRLANKALEA